MSKPQRPSTAPMASDYPRKERVCAECKKPKPILLTYEKIGGGYVMMCSGCAPQRADTFKENAES